VRASAQVLEQARVLALAWVRVWVLVLVRASAQVLEQARVLALA